jgi:hypothetical protein
LNNNNLNKTVASEVKPKCEWAIPSSTSSASSSLQIKPKSLTSIVEEEEQLRQLAFRHQLNKAPQHMVDMKNSSSSSSSSGSPDITSSSKHKRTPSSQEHKKVNEEFYKYNGANRGDSRWFVPRTASALTVSDIIQQEQEEQRLKDEVKTFQEQEAKDIELAIALVAQKEAEEKEAKLKWPCDTCTFLNHFKDSHCAMCNSMKKKNTKPSKKSAVSTTSTSTSKTKKVHQAPTSTTHKSIATTTSSSSSKKAGKPNSSTHNKSKNIILDDDNDSSTIDRSTIEVKDKGCKGVDGDSQKKFAHLKKKKTATTTTSSSTISTSLSVNAAEFNPSFS